MTTSVAGRWEALDILRGLSVIFMLLNLVPGSWSQQYSWLKHVQWEGGHAVDMVAPVFLFCIGAAAPFALRSRLRGGTAKGAIARHILLRSLMLVAIGLALNIYPDFDWAHTRIPGVLQRIGLTYGLAALFLLALAQRGEDGSVRFPIAPVAGAIGFILVSYWLLLYAVPSPGFGAPRFDPLGAWPSVVDRAVFTVPHLFKYFPINGQVIFDPEGILSTWPALASVLMGALASLAHTGGWLKRPALQLAAAGVVMMVAAVALSGICPIIKNLWTPTFALFSTGLALALLAALTPLAGRPRAEPLLLPARVFGSNPLLAYVICFALSPLFDLDLIRTADGPTNLRDAGQELLSRGLSPNLASLTFGLVFLALLGAFLWVCYRRRWFWRL